MPRRKTLKVVAAIATSLAVLAGTIIILAQMGTITPGMAKLMLVALLALYIGFGFLIAVYRLIGKLD